MSTKHRLICTLRRFGLGLAIVGSLAATSAIAGTQYVIVGSEPASDEFPAGKVMAPGDTLVVPQGTAVTLLGDDGSVNTVPGPAEVAITEEAVTTGSRSATEGDASRTTISKIAGLLTGERERAETLGVSRSVPGKPSLKGLDDPWTISVHASGPGCIKDGEVVLARSDGSNAINLAFRTGESEGSRDIVWGSGESKFRLEKPVSPTEKKLVVEAGKEFANVELHMMPDAIDQKNPLDVIGWMIDKGCSRQAIAFVKSLGAEAR